MASMILLPADNATFERRPSIVSSSCYSVISSSSPEVTIASTEATVSTPESQDQDQDSRLYCTTTSPDSIVPKLEELEVQNESYELEDAKPVIDNESSSIAILAAPKKRGRPRKHPIVDVKKTSHARSKTGCATCRRRKKKCDETKPTCQNCEKNNVICDGYERPERWKSGKQKQLVQRQAICTELPALSLGAVGVETQTDMMFLQYFVRKVGTVLSLTDHGNPFLQIIVPMATRHAGLMHSVLYLSGSCLLAAMDDNGDWDWQVRQAYHSSRALKLLQQDLEHQNPESSHHHGTVTSPSDHSVAQTLVLCLQTIGAGDVKGTYRFHLDALKKMLGDRTIPNDRLRQFILEFLLYHDYSNAITSITNPLDSRSLALMNEFKLPAYMLQPEAGTLLGVMDGLFEYISRIRSLRDRIRDIKRQGGNWWEDDSINNEAFAIDGALRGWNWKYEPDSPRYTAGLLYRQCTWIYLQRTVLESTPSTAIKNAVDQGLDHLRRLPWDSDDGATQSILLMPLFLLGCAAFCPEQRPPIAQALQRLEEWSRLGNIKYARQIVEEIWEMMDRGLEEETWDWELIMAKKGWDFLVT